MTMTEAERNSAPRLLPWSTEDGKRCFLISDGSDSFLSRRADDVEQMQLALGSELLEQVIEVLEDPTVSPRELRFFGKTLAHALRDTLKVAESRGARLGIAPGMDADDGESTEGT
ncbi:hypothetical protein [Streptomyces sp. NBC_00989]|uniref:hypothetical protein n=1 Tax=Streptomyces sp. NBC_00989 TaxID=2903705 RepID=UPI00386ECE23|nr:hypothetical protein OG714_18145 [Streptomyces sp. NBC_00989]